MKQSSLIKFLLSLTILLNVDRAHSQFFDSLEAKLGLTYLLASEPYQPQWAVANKFGTVQDRKSDLISYVSMSNQHRLITKKKYSDDGTDTTSYLMFNYGLSLYNNSVFHNTFFEQAFASLSYKNWALKIGRFEERLGIHNRLNSIGSFGISGNSRPIPKISIGTTDYVVIPLFNNWLRIKGTFAHGWFGNDRFMKKAYYHEKTLYLKVGPGPLKVFGGVQHFAEWGGRRPGLPPLDRSWKGFKNVVFVTQADDGSVGTSINGRLPSRPGDQRGLIEFGLELDVQKNFIQVYGQMPFESGEEIDTRNRSFLVGGELIPKRETATITDALIEFIYTKDMNSFVIARQRQSYYNNGYYKTGWEYEDHVIGNPLFLNRTRLNKFFSDIIPFDWNLPNDAIPGNANILNNRIIALHGALGYNLFNLKAKILLTYTRNYGDLSQTSPIRPHKSQVYTLNEVKYTSHRHPLTITLGLGADFGQLTNNLGALVGLEWHFSHKK